MLFLKEIVFLEKDTLCLPTYKFDYYIKFWFLFTMDLQ